VIRVELGEEVGRRGKWRWTCPRYALMGVSRAPLLEACRAIKSISGDTSERVGLFREVSSIPSLSCTVGWGAGRTVDENGPWFKKWVPFKSFGSHSLDSLSQITVQ
jgi:hypothetical protein